MTDKAFSSARGSDASRQTCANHILANNDRELVLASTSATLRRILEASGLVVRVAFPCQDETETLKQVFREVEELDPADVAELCMHAKLEHASNRFSGGLVVSAHQIISLGGKSKETPQTLDAARDLLFELRGKTHQLHSAIALAEEGKITWSSVGTAHLTMRPLSAQFVGRYVAAAGEQAIGSPGGYQLDGVGLQLFEHIEGRYPAVLGAPLLQLYARLREIGFLAS